MSKPYMPLMMGDWIRGTRGMRANVKGVYIGLLIHQYDHGYLPADVETLTLIEPEVGSVWVMLSDKFPEVEPGKRKNLKLEEVRAFWSKQGKNGEKGGRPKKNNPDINPNHNPKANPNYNHHIDIDIDIDYENDNEVELHPTFKDFWDAYGKKVDRDKCQKKWAKIKQADREKIMAHVPQYVASTPDINYRRHPATYLNNESWNNEIIRNGNSAKQITRDDRVNFIKAKYGTAGTPKG